MNLIAKISHVLSVAGLLVLYIPVAANSIDETNVFPGVSFKITRPEIPVLVGNKHGGLLQIIVTVGKVVESDAHSRSDVRLTSISFSLEGTDSLSDIESLELLSMESAENFPGGSVCIPLGERQSSAPKITFYMNSPLDSGKNVFWLSAKLRTDANLSNHISARCLFLETSAGRHVPKKIVADGPQRVGVALRKQHDDGVHTYRIPALATTKVGTLIVAYDMRRRSPGHDLQGDIDIGISRSCDEGKTWDPIRVAMDMGEYGGLAQDQNGVSDPGLLVDQTTGTIFLFALWMNGKPGHHQWKGEGSESGYEIGRSAQFLVVRSQDDGRTWSKPENLTRNLKKSDWRLLAPSPTTGICLDDGTMVMPVQGRIETDDPFSALIISRDHGNTWTLSKPATGAIASESQVAQLSDGSLMLNMRTEQLVGSLSEKYRSVYITNDLGETWSPHATNRNTIIESGCNASLLSVKLNKENKKKQILLFANPHSQKSRTHQSIQVSYDDGRTWPEEKRILLDEYRGAGYPSLARINENEIGIVYEGSQAHLVFQKILLAEMLSK